MLAAHSAFRCLGQTAPIGAPQSRWSLARRELAAPGFAREFLLFLAATCGGGGAALLLLVALAGEAARG